MVFDVSLYKSHPDKFLLSQPTGEKGHVNGVIENVRKLTDSKVAELLATFHDLGKLNPNFQQKLDSQKKSNEYSNHAYLSAYSFFSFCSIEENYRSLCDFLGKSTITSQELFGWTVLIAKHHGNIPNFDTPDGLPPGTSYHALSVEELKMLFKFIKTIKLPLSDYVRVFDAFNNTKSFEDYCLNERMQKQILEKFRFIDSGEKGALDFFLDTQFIFSCLIQADKADAAKHDNFIDENLKSVELFCSIYSNQLTEYLKKLNQDSPLNRMRTQIRLEAVIHIDNSLKKGHRIFELTSPTGSGKTLILLSLAQKILESKGNFRIIYALPFLSITEQVEAEVLDIFSGYENHVRRVDSKSENNRFEELQNKIDDNPTAKNFEELSFLELQENTFAYPFIITTFVRFFETLLSNRNSELLKLPNFSSCIFLIDEIQSLPPRLYGFLIAYLSKFCEKYNSYAIISTATQPNFSLPEKKEIRSFFSGYEAPLPLLSPKYFEDSLFNRYQIHYNNVPVTIEELKKQILNESKSVLIILNTIDDTKDLYKSFRKDGYSTEEILLLNTHFTPKHRKLKIQLAKRQLKQSKKVILISTQLIEAGVDIDFPVLYRDFAIVASIIQSAGRCNRNGKLSQGKVVLLKLINKDKIRSELIYQGKDKELLTFTKDAFIETSYEEKNLLMVQKGFFDRIKSELNFAKHDQKNPKLQFDFIKDIRQAQFKKIGSFQLIDKELFGEEHQYYVPKNEKDNKFEDLLNYHNELIIYFKSGENDIRNIKLLKSKIIIHLKRMANQIVQVRLIKNHEPLKSHEDNYYQLSKIALSSYSFEEGIDLIGDCIL